MTSDLKAVIDENVKESINKYLSSEESVNAGVVLISLSNQIIKLNFDIPTKEKGLQEYNVKVKSIDEENNLYNNQKSFSIDVIDKTQNILILAKAPHPDLGALNWALSDQLKTSVNIEYIDDFVDGFEIVMEKGINREIYNIGNDSEPIQIINLAKKMVQSSKKRRTYRSKLNKYNRKKGTYGNGDGYWRHLDSSTEKEGSVIPDIDTKLVHLQDPPGWHCKLGYYGEKKEHDEIMWHSAYGGPRITLGWVVFDQNIWDDIVEELTELES